jgi:peptidoglycan LD-endopeptidase LytH
VQLSRSRAVAWPLCASFWLVTACAPALQTGTITTSSPARDAYIRERARASDPSIARWTEAGDAALRAPMAVELPYGAYYELDESMTTVGAYAFDLHPGGRLQAHLSAFGEPAAAFVELFLQQGAQLLLVDADIDRARTVSRDGGRYLVRVQPRLGTVGTFRLSIEGDGARPAIVASAAPLRTLPASHYVFPVEGRDASAIQSDWGDPRGGGRRHEGVDIFAARGTPVLAATDGVVIAVRRTPIGGRVIWLRPDGEDLELYYAHLDRQDVLPGARVRAGQRIGLVGNTGNARTTPPHLHFGVYRAGGRIAINPDDFIARSAPVLLGGAQ